ncbi:adenosylcobinamide-GDP ribazoletransferase [Pelolinea submarina]|nr:adenosylcobinamide-GDP ribazoletransferase [Pelolinea submarina]
MKPESANMFDSLITALDFLTVLPVPHRKDYKPLELGKAAAWFPWVGALLGGLTALVYYGLLLILPRMLASALAVAFWIAVTGGLHLDGLADCCDGLLYAGTPQRRLEIMKDPHHGTFADIGLPLTILIKIAALYSLPLEVYGLALPLAGALSRWLLLPAGKQANARPGGLGEQFSASLQKGSFYLALIPVIILTYQLGWQAIAVAAVVHVCAWLIFRTAQVRLGGMTGDVYGLVVELGELLVLMGFCVRGL